MNQACNEKQQREAKFHKFQLVWGKIVGWPWWPARIAEIPSPEQSKYKVEFIADATHAFLAEDKLVNYQQARNQHSTPKIVYRNFHKAIAEADKLLGFDSVCKLESKHNYQPRSKGPDQQIQIINQDVEGKCSQVINTQQIQQQKEVGEADQPRKKTHRKSSNRISRIDRPRKLIVKKRKIQQRQEIIARLLKQYKLDQIPKYEAVSLIKRGSNKKSTAKSFSGKDVRLLVARAISRIIKSKGIDVPIRNTISVMLSEALIKAKQKGSKGAHRALFQWLSSNDQETIVASYSSWPLEDKNDHFTTESY